MNDRRLLSSTLREAVMLLANDAERPSERRDAAVLIAYLAVEIAPDDVTLGLLRTGTMSVIDDLTIVTSVARALATFPGDRWTFGRTMAVLARHAVAGGHPVPLLCPLGRLLGVASWRPLADPALCIRGSAKRGDLHPIRAPSAKHE